jgi:hypothetical protein
MRHSMKWAKGAPNEIGQHFVAVQVGQGAGWYDFMEWDGEKWACRPTEAVIAFMSLQDLVQQLKIEWPGDQPAISLDAAQLSKDDLDFQEI